MRTVNLAVIGAGTSNDSLDLVAYQVGKRIALERWNLICGGLGGVMKAASKGAFENNGTTIGILPGNCSEDANEYITIAIPTGLGHARNAVIATSSDGLIAIGGEYGTLSEIALGFKMGKPVVAVSCSHNINGVLTAVNAQEAINILKPILNRRVA